MEDHDLEYVDVINDDDVIELPLEDLKDEEE